MERVKIHDREFVLMLSEEQILARVSAIAEEINKSLEGENPLFLVVLNGAFMFAADLLKRITIPCEVSFVKLASYQGTTSTGKVREIIGINEDISNRTIVIVEDIIDSGLTMKQMTESLGTRNPKRVCICTLFVKRGKMEFALDIDYAAIELGDEFIVGYGLDYEQQGRNLKNIYVVAD